MADNKTKDASQDQNEDTQNEQKKGGQASYQSDDMNEEEETDDMGTV